MRTAFPGPQREERPRGSKPRPFLLNRRLSLVASRARAPIGGAGGRRGLKPQQRTPRGSEEGGGAGAVGVSAAAAGPGRRLGPPEAGTGGNNVRAEKPPR